MYTRFDSQAGTAAVRFCEPVRTPARIFWAVSFLLFCFASSTSWASAAVDGAPIDSGIIRATVERVLSDEVVEIPGAGATTRVQTLEAITDEGERAFITNDRVPLAEGDSFFVSWQEGSDGPLYTVREADRRSVLLIAVLLFAFSTILVGGWIGVRALISLGISIVVIVFVLLPQLAHGASPVLTATTSAAVILGLAMLVTHGANRHTAAAFGASVVTIIGAIFLGSASVSLARLSGFTDDTSTILNLSTGGTLNMEGLLLGAFIIGILGIIDDLAVTQVLTVQELRAASAALSARDLYRRAMRVGREHLGAVVNTLVLAYVGSALPLMLLFSLSPSDPLYLINSEVLAVEILRAAVGGVALAAVLPLATWFGVLVAKNGLPQAHHGHSHGGHT